MDSPFALRLQYKQHWRLNFAAPEIGLFFFRLSAMAKNGLLMEGSDQREAVWESNTPNHHGGKGLRSHHHRLSSASSLQNTQDSIAMVAILFDIFLGPLNVYNLDDTSVTWRK